MNQKTLTFNEDGSIDREQLAGYPDGFIAQVLSPDFQERARQMIAQDKRRQIERREFLKELNRVRMKAQEEHEARRPSAVTGRQRKRLRRIVRKMAHATMPRGESLEAQ